MKCIGIVKDEDLGFKSKRFYKTRNRVGARGIIINDDGKIAIFNKQKKNEYKLPGGGVESLEDINEAFKREAKEETGCDVEIIKEIGTIEEHKSLDNFKQKSYIFIAKVLKESSKLNLTKEEIENGGRILWVTPEEGIKLISDSFDKITASDDKNIYHTKFIVYRDKLILDYYMKNYLYDNSKHTVVKKEN